jgi:hypothetical protein
MPSRELGLTGHQKGAWFAASAAAPAPGKNLNISHTELLAQWACHASG